MNTERLAIADLHPDPANVRLHPERNLQAIRSSLARFGQVKPIVVDANNVVRAGNGTLEAARQLGWDSVLCVRTTLAGSEATAYAIADNRTGELAEWDEAALAETLRAVRDEGIDLDAIGYSSGEIDAMVAGLGAGIAGEVVDDPAGEWQGMPECQNEDKTAYQSIHIHFKDQEGVDGFARLIGQKITANTRSLWYPKIEIESYADKAYASEAGDES